MVFCGPTQEPVLAAANTEKNSREVLEKNAGEWTRRVKLGRKKSKAIDVACRAIYWPAPGLKRTFELWVRNLKVFNVCVCSITLAVDVACRAIWGPASRLRKNLWALGSQQMGLSFLRLLYPTWGRYRRSPDLGGSKTTLQTTFGCTKHPLAIVLSQDAACVVRAQLGMRLTSCSARLNSVCGYQLLDVFYLN